MSTRFALSLPLADAALLGPLRNWSAIELCATGDAVWLRAAHLEEEQWEWCRRLPGANRYQVLSDGQLLSVGSIVPRGFLPAGPWEELARWLRVELPPANISLAVPQRTSIQLVRASQPHPASWLLTSMAAWSAYVESAPQVRLARWTFAADATGNAVVRGTPLPPLRGTQYVDHAGIGVPAGWTWSPALDAASVRATLRLDQGDCALWMTDGAWQKIAAGDWVKATRSAVRLTVRGQSHER